LSTGFLYDPAFLDHDTGAGHPETSQRLVATMAHLESQSWFTTLKRYSPATVDPKWLRSIHAADYIARARDASARGLPYLDSVDVAICAASYDIALLAVGGALQLADKVVSREVDNAFALMRPPGHHAEHGEALGFCIFNNVAIMAKYLQQHHGLDKILILDWDVHHGNGTQHSFEQDPSVMYVSTHQYPYYPGTGAASETGHGAGDGSIVNCPMPAGSGDALYEQAFSEVILPKVNAFAPEAVIVSAGFDAHRDDPLAQMQLSTEFFAWMSTRLLEVAAQHAGGRLISVLEGGYNLEMLPRCVSTHLQALSGSAPSRQPGADGAATETS
jgi:acetoin utilization deacetylase AcuC-like enzyme